MPQWEDRFYKANRAHTYLGKRVGALLLCCDVGGPLLLLCCQSDCVAVAAGEPRATDTKDVLAASQLTTPI